MARRLILVAAACLFAAEPEFANAETEENPLIPMHPKSLLGILPKSPDGWKLKQSEGRTVYGGWLYSMAARKYERPADDATPLPAVTQLSIRDTVRHPASLAIFRARSEAPGSGGNIRRFKVDDYPAVALLSSGDEKKWSLRILVNERFVIEVRLEGQPEADAEKWLKMCNLAALKRAPEKRAGKPLEVVEIVQIDELKPARSRSYRMGITTEEDVAAIAERTAKEYRKMGLKPPEAREAEESGKTAEP